MISMSWVIYIDVIENLGTRDSTSLMLFMF